MEATMNLKVGILAIQGAFSEHKTCLARAINDLNTLNKAEGKPGASLDAIEVRERSHVEGLDGMIIPGGESTTMGKSLERNGFGEAIKSWMGQSKKPVVWGTCAGMILLANDLEHTKIGGQAHLGGLDVKVSRNFFGRQVNSFEASLDIKASELIGKEESSCSNSYHGVFIRAPAVSECTSDNVEVLGTILHQQKKDTPVIVAVKQNNVIATAFHPELTDDLRWHKYFLNLVIKEKVTS